MNESLIVLGIFVFLVIITLSAGIKIVPQGYNWTVERFGRYTRTLSPGLNLLIPYVDRVGHKIIMMEQVLADVDASEPGQWRIARLRYFNPVGAHASGLIGEDPQDIPNNLLPYVAQVAVGLREQLSVYGNDYPTADGTGVRDYIHVCDLAEGHVAALRYLRAHPGLLTVNLGTGRGYSVLDVVRAFEIASGRPVPYDIVERRPGDIAQCYAEPGLANRLLGWVAARDLTQMCADAWNWQRNNPEGYA